MFGSLRAARREPAAIVSLARLPADVVGVSALLVLTAIVAWDRVGTGQSLSRTDILTFYLPWYSFLGEHLRAFDIPAWNPHVFSGAPFAGDPQSGWMYAPAMLLFTLLPPVAAFTAFVVFHLAFGGLTTYALARVLGMRVAASVLAGVAFEFSAFLEHTRCCTIRAQLTVWIPLALLGVELATRGRTWRRRLGWWSVTGFAISQMLAAWIGQGAYNGLLIVGGYVFYRTVLSPNVDHQRFRDRLTGLALHGAAVLAIGLGLGAAGFLPRLATVSRSNLAGADYEGSGEGAGGWVLIHLLYRILNDMGTSVRWYVGGATIALAVMAPFVARRRYGTPFFAVYSLVALTLALDDTALHRIFYLLPRFQELHEHVPNRVLAVLPVGLALLAGATVESIPRWTRRWWAFPIAALPLAALLVIQPELGERGWRVTANTTNAIRAVCLLLLVAATLGIPSVRRRVPRLTTLAHGIVPVMLVAVVFWDPTGAWWGRSLRDTEPDPRPEETIASLITSRDAGGPGEFLQERHDDELSRFFGYDAGLLGGDRRNRSYQGRYRQRAVRALLVNNRAARLGLHDIQGYNPIQVERYVQLFNAINNEPQDYHDSNVLAGGLNSPLLDLLNVRYVVVPADAPPGRPDLLHLSQRNQTVFSGARARVLERASALPRAWIVHDVRRIRPGTALLVLTSGQIDPRHTALIESDPPPLSQPADPARESVTVDAYEADRIRLNARLSADGMVVLSESYDPGWRAFVDGEETPVVIADHALRAVAVPAGQHTIELRYEPPALRRGLAITGGTVAALIVAAGLLLWRRSPRTNGETPGPETMGSRAS